MAHIDFFNHDLALELIEATDWKEAVQKHTKYPFASTEEYQQPSIEELLAESKRRRERDGSEELAEEELFRQLCFDCDAMMNWLEV